ncbi:MAG: glycosyltransferase family 1 protein [Actinomycetota bacterium]|nr:glycosyltransferase family 1 protein [Actinomycetota bacterium]
MKVAVVAESFLPSVNGVVRSVEMVLRHLERLRCEVLVLAPATSESRAPSAVSGATVVRLPAAPLVGYPDIRIALTGIGRIRSLISDFAPDVVHLASPFELGWRAARAAAQLGVPAVAVYQTDVPGYLRRYGLPLLENWAWQRVTDIHGAAARTLAPSSAAVAQLTARGVPRVRLWARGVDAEAFHPRNRDAALRAGFAPCGERIIGYVGRLAAEKQVADLAAVADIPGTRLVIVGDGPERPALEAALPSAVFTGMLTGSQLSAAMASLDVFVHPGELETFGQTIQEAMASGVPVVATGRGGPLDLVDHSRTGWLYRPGDLSDLRGRVSDLVGDDAKRAAFASAARAGVAGRTWPALCGQLMRHYDEVRAEQALLPR